MRAAVRDRVRDSKREEEKRDETKTKGDCTNSSLSLFACSLDNFLVRFIIKANKSDNNSVVVAIFFSLL